MHEKDDMRRMTKEAGYILLYCIDDIIAINLT